MSQQDSKDQKTHLFTHKFLYWILITASILLLSALLLSIAYLRRPLQDEGFQTTVVADYLNFKNLTETKLSIPETITSKIEHRKLGEYRTEGKFGFIFLDLLLVVIIKLLGIGYFQVRVGSIFCGIGALSIFTLIAHKIFKGDKLLAIFALILLGTSPLFLGMSSLCRPEIFLTLTILSAFWFYIKSNETGSLYYYFLCGLFAGLSMSAHPHGLFVVASFFLLVSFDNFQSVLFFKKTTIWISGLLVSALLWLYFFDFDWFLWVTQMGGDNSKAESFFLFQHKMWTVVPKMLQKIFSRSSSGFLHSTISIDGSIRYEFYIYWLAIFFAAINFKKLNIIHSAILKTTLILYLLFELGESTGRGGYLIYLLPLLILSYVSFIQFSLEYFSLNRFPLLFAVGIISIYAGAQIISFNLNSPGIKEFVILSLILVLPFLAQHLRNKLVITTLFIICFIIYRLPNSVKSKTPVLGISIEPFILLMLFVFTLLLFLGFIYDNIIEKRVAINFFIIFLTIGIVFRSRFVIYEHTYKSLKADPSWPAVMSEIRGTIPEKQKVAGHLGMWLYLQNRPFVDFYPEPIANLKNFYNYLRFKNALADFYIYDSHVSNDSANFAENVKEFKLVKRIETNPFLDVGTINIYKLKPREN